MLPVLPFVLVRLNIAPVDVPPVETEAAESLIYTLPEVLAINVGALVNILAPLVPIAPLVELEVKVPVVDIRVDAA